LLSHFRLELAQPLVTRCHFQLPGGSTTQYSIVPPGRHRGRVSAIPNR
jgi:hypothetical protein